MSPTNSEAALALQAQDRLDELNQLTQDLSCSTDDDCAAIGLGHKPCGGYNDYKVYSRSHVDASQVKMLAQSYYQTTRELNTLVGTISTCEMLSEPSVQCVVEVCQKVEN